MSFITKFLRTLLVNFTSRALWVTAIALIYERWDYWASCSAIWTFDSDGKLNAYVAMASQHRWFVGTVLLGYVGLLTAKNFSGNVAANLQSVVSTASSYAKSESKETREDIQHIVRENEEKFLNDPSYAPIKKDTEVPFR